MLRRTLVFALFLATLRSNLGTAACNITGGKLYGDCSGVQINKSTRGRLNVKSQVIESGIIQGATVYDGGALTLTGISNGEIIVHKGGTLRVSGVVNGAVINRGGNVEIEGTVNTFETSGGRSVIGGVVGDVAGRGPVTYKKGAVIGGVPTQRTIRNSDAR